MNECEVGSMQALYTYLLQVDTLVGRDVCRRLRPLERLFKLRHLSPHLQHHLVAVPQLRLQLQYSIAQLQHLKQRSEPTGEQLARRDNECWPTV